MDAHDQPDTRPAHVPGVDMEPTIQAMDPWLSSYHHHPWVNAIPPGSPHVPAQARSWPPKNVVPSSFASFGTYSLSFPLASALGSTHLGWHPPPTSTCTPNPPFGAHVAVGYDPFSSPSSSPSFNVAWAVEQQQGTLQPNSPSIVTPSFTSVHLISPAASNPDSPLDTTASTVAMLEDRRLLSTPPTGISPSQISPVPPTSPTSSSGHDKQEPDLTALPAPLPVLETTMTLHDLLGPAAVKCVGLRTTGVSPEMKHMMGVFRLDPFTRQSNGHPGSRVSAAQGRGIMAPAPTMSMTVEDVAQLAADAEDNGIRLRDHAICYDGTRPGPLQAPSVLVEFQVSAFLPDTTYFILHDSALTHYSLHLIYFTECTLTSFLQVNLEDPDNLIPYQVQFPNLFPPGSPSPPMSPQHSSSLDRYVHTFKGSRRKLQPGFGLGLACKTELDTGDLHQQSEWSSGSLTSASNSFVDDKYHSGYMADHPPTRHLLDPLHAIHSVHPAYHAEAVAHAHLQGYSCPLGPTCGYSQDRVQAQAQVQAVSPHDLTLTSHPVLPAMPLNSGGQGDSYPTCHRY
jgi:hypothetical protein